MIAGFVLIFATCSHGDCVADYPVTEDIYRTGEQCEAMRERLMPLYADRIVCGEVYRANTEKMDSVVSGR